MRSCPDSAFHGTIAFEHTLETADFDFLSPMRRIGWLPMAPVDHSPQTCFSACSFFASTDFSAIALKVPILWPDNFPSGGFSVCDTCERFAELSSRITNNSGKSFGRISLDWISYSLIVCWNVDFIKSVSLILQSINQPTP